MIADVTSHMNSNMFLARFLVGFLVGPDIVPSMFPGMSLVMTPNMIFYRKVPMSKLPNTGSHIEALIDKVPHIGF